MQEDPTAGKGVIRYVKKEDKKALKPNVEKHRIYSLLGKDGI